MSYAKSGIKKIPTIKQMFLDILITLKYIHVFERTNQKNPFYDFNSNTKLTNGVSRSTLLDRHILLLKFYDKNVSFSLVIDI